MAKKKFAFIVPATLAAAAIGGVVSGAAGTVGRKAVEDAWNNKEPKPIPKVSEHVYQINVGNMTRYELDAAIAELKEAWEDAHAKSEEPSHSPFYPKV
jgi:hypothetical protein